MLRLFSCNLIVMEKHIFYIYANVRNYYFNSTFVEKNSQLEYRTRKVGERGKFHSRFAKYDIVFKIGSVKRCLYENKVLFFSL